MDVRKIFKKSFPHRELNRQIGNPNILNVGIDDRGREGDTRTEENVLTRKGLDKSAWE